MRPLTTLRFRGLPTWRRARGASERPPPSRARPKLAGWAASGFAMPAPPRVKRAVLHRLGEPSGTWVESGTFEGTTTAFLAREARHVYSIEPEPDLARQATERFEDHERVTILHGLSEDRLPEVLEWIEGTVSFWLDGHYSAGRTYRGPTDTPIRAELDAIEKHLSRLGSVTVLVDDVRCFDPSIPQFSAYPSRGWLVRWAERNDLTWNIEHDIFAAWRRG